MWPKVLLNCPASVAATNYKKLKSKQMFGNIYLSLQEIRANITLVAFLDVAVDIVLLAEHLLTNLTLMRVLCRTGFLGLLWIRGQQWLYLFPLSKLSQSSWNFDL